MKAKFFIGLAVSLSLVSGLLANGLNLNGFGARAVTMGGAFVGLADDYTAVFWNPAGLALMRERTFGLSGDLIVPSGRYTRDAYRMETKSKIYPAGLVGYFQPIGDRIVVGVGAYTLSGLGAAWDNTGLEEALVAPSPPSFFTPNLEAYSWSSLIGSVTIAPSIAVKLSEQVFLGATFNINYGFFQTEQWGMSREIVVPPPLAMSRQGMAAMAPPSILINFGQRSLDVKGWGFGATIGLLVKPADWISFGATFRTQSKVKLSGTMDVENLDLLEPYMPIPVEIPTSSGTSMSVPSPMWLAGGVAVKPMENLTLTFDAQYTNWAKLGVIALEFDEGIWTTLLGDEAQLRLNWANKTQFRAGIEYDLGNFALRAGYYYDPAPAPDETLNILTPSFTHNGIAAGFGYKKGGLTLDLGLEYLIGRDRNVDEATGNLLYGLYEMTIIVPVMSLSYGW